MSKELISIHRVESRAPQKNTIEWEIPNEALISLMLVEKIGYLFLAKIKIPKKHWWSRSHETKTFSGQDIMILTSELSDFLEKYGYYIDGNSIQLGERVGDF